MSKSEAWNYFILKFKPSWPSYKFPPKLCQLGSIYNSYMLRWWLRVESCWIHCSSKLLHDNKIADLIVTDTVTELLCCFTICLVHFIFYLNLQNFWPNVNLNLIRQCKASNQICVIFCRAKVTPVVQFCICLFFLQDTLLYVCDYKYDWWDCGFRSEDICQQVGCCSDRVGARFSVWSSPCL